MQEEVVKLEEIELIYYSNINAVSLGLIPKEMRTFTQYEKQLETAGDFKPIHLLSLLGGSLDVDPIINAISGRTKRLKKYIKIEKKQENFKFLEDNYTEFLSSELKLKGSEIGLFFSYLIENEIFDKNIKDNKKEKMKFFLTDEWNSYKNLINDSNLENH